MRTRLILLSMWLVMSAAAEGPPRLHYILRVFTLPKPEAQALLIEDLDDSALHQRLTDAAKANPQVLEKLIVLASDEGEHAEVQLANEFYHPTEFDPQQMPQELAIGDSGLAHALQKFLHEPPYVDPPNDDPKPPAKPKTAQGKAPADLLRHPVNGGLGIIGSISPTAFEMKPLGDRLQLECDRDGTPFDLGITINLEGTRLAGIQEINGEQLAQFSTRKINSRILVKRNAPIFLGTLSRAQRTGSEFETKEPGVSFAFLTARQIPLPVAAPAPAAVKDGEFMVHFEVFSLPKLEASTLIDEALADATLHERIKSAKNSKLETFLSGPVTPAQMTELEDSNAYTYATQFDPPQITQQLVIADDQLLADLRAGRQTGTGAPPSANAGTQSGGFGLMTRTTPTAFATRMLGTKLSIEIYLNEQHLSIEAKPELTRLIGERNYTGAKQPIFESMSLTATTTARIGLPHFLGTLNRPFNTGLKEGNQGDRVWFAFVTVRE